MWCTNCGAQLADGVKFCTTCGNKIEEPGNQPANGGNDSTFVLGSAVKDNQNAYNDVQPGNANKPQVPVYAPSAYEENKTAKAKNGTAAYIIIIVICFLVIAVSAGLVIWTVMGDSKGKKNDSDIVEEEDDEDEDDEDEDEDEDDDEEDEDDGDLAEEASEAAATEESVPQYEDPAVEEPAEEYPEEEYPEEEEESQYLLEDSDCRNITEEELYDFDAWECRLARNELYARHGRIFDTPEVQEYFESKDWYHGTITSDEWNSGKGDNKYFNDYEINNRDLIVKYEKKMGYK